MSEAAKARVLAYYLPQYYPIPENDEQWGPGFTEWTNVAKARNLYPGQQQPKLPADLGFYDLRVEESRAAQAKMAHHYGIEGFLYYHYWFGGRRLLERPFNEVLSSGKPDFPFCLCWANHSWTGIWDGAPDKLIVEQVYPGMQDHREHFEFLLQAFRDPRYVTVDGKPFFAVYHPHRIPEVHRVTDLWREMAHQAGLPGLHLVTINQMRDYRPEADGFDAVIAERLPARDGKVSWQLPWIKLYYLLTRAKQPTIYSYKKTIRQLVRHDPVDFEQYPCIIPNWDNTPRSGSNGLVLHGSTPELFAEQLNMGIDKVQSLSPEHRIVIIKAWNEWAEGNYLEPDQRHGHAYLEQLQQALR